MKNRKYYTVSEGLFVTPYEQICHLYHGTNKLLFYKNDHEVCFVGMPTGWVIYCYISI